MKIKRLISLVLALILLVSSVPVAARAETSQPSVDSGDITVEGTNGFGTLLSKEIARYQSDSEDRGNYPGGYTVTGLEISGNQATITYDSMEEAQLLVALYTEDGIQLLTSASVTVSPEETQAVVTFDGEMPQYFIASAYLLDSYDYSPLCSSYATPMYTREMQELLASTVDDYDPDRVLNLDSDKTTNFAVYAEDTIVISSSSGVNTVTGVDDTNHTYVITNADEQITGLQPGDVFVYPYVLNDYLIVKVAEIRIDGTTVTITGTDLAMEDAFSHVKIDGSTDSEDLVVIDLDPNDGIDYQGTGSGMQTQAWEGDGEVTATEHFGLDETFPNEKLNTEVTIQGGLDFILNFKYQFYITQQRQFLQLQLDAAVGLSTHVDGEISTTFKNFAEFKVGPFHGVTFACKPAFELAFRGEVQSSTMVTATLGFAYDSEKGCANLCTTPRVTSELDVAAEFFIGIDLNPQAVFLTESIAELELSIPIGLTVGAELTGTDVDAVLPGASDGEPHIHSCKKCLDITVSVQPSLDLKLKFLNCDRLTYEESYVLARFSWPFYKSLTYDEFGAGSCPYEKYRVSIEVRDTDGKCKAEADINAYHQESGNEARLGSTNSRGVLMVYLRPGQYIFSTEANAETYKCKSDISDACKVAIVLKPDDNPPDVGDGQVDYGSITDGEVIASGRCGDDLRWRYYSGGRLEIFGAGDMYNYDDYSSFPWYGIGIITELIVRKGVTSISRHAFYGQPALASVMIPDSVTTIGAEAFWECNSLVTVTIGDGVTNLDAFRFSGCTSLKNVTIGDGVTAIKPNTFMDCSNLTGVIIGSGVTAIGSHAFSGCTHLGSVTIPDSVTTIDACAFVSCTSLASVTFGNGLVSIDSQAFMGCTKLADINLPEGITTIGDSAFYHCEKLTGITIPDSVTDIGDYAFHSCYSLTGITIPDGMTSIGRCMFYNCSSLIRVTIPNSVTAIGDSAFYGCKKLTDISIPDGITTIGNSAFYGCEKLSSITIPKGLTAISDNAFTNCYILQSITIPGSVKSIGVSAFYNCFGLTSVTIPDSVTTVAMGAFGNCDGLKTVTIGKGVTAIGQRAFYACDKLTGIHVSASNPNYYSDSSGVLFNKQKTELIQAPCSLAGTSYTVPVGVTTIGIYAFYDCQKLYSVTVPVSVTTIGTDAFNWCSKLKNVYYGGSQAQWERIKIATGNYELTNATINYNSTGPAVNGLPELLPSGDLQRPDLPVDEPKPDQVFGGDYGTDSIDGRTLKTASFTGLVPGGQYVLLALVDIDADDLLSPENLLFIEQVAAGEDGAFTFCYAQRVNTAVSHVIACGPSTQNLADATIIFPNMVSDANLQVVNPTVIYDGKTLTEGVDYVIVGTVDYTHPGTYTCYIRGIYNYTGLVKCLYTVNERTAPAKPYKIANVVSGVHVYWKATEGAVKYGLWRSETGKNGTYKWLGNPTVPHFTDTKVVSGKTYYYKITAMDSYGSHSPKSEAIGIVYVGTPDITNRFNKAAGITLGWNKIQGATGYAIYRKSYSGNDAWVRVGTISGNATFTWQDTSVKSNNGSAYKYTIRALAGADMKTLSGCRNAGRSMVRLTSRTLSSAVKSGATSIKCTWTTSSAVTGYEVRFMVGSTVYKTFTIGNYKTGVKTFTGLKAGQTYKIQVRSYVKIDGMGFYSAWSEAKSVKLP